MRLQSDLLISITQFFDILNVLFQEINVETVL